LDQELFAEWQQLIADWIGIQLLPEKSYLVADRLQPLLARYGCGNLKGLIKHARVDPRLRHEIIERMTTHETHFFRDPGAFGGFKLLLQQRFGGKPAGVRIFSAGCSSGEEAYSIAITAHEVGVPAQILAVDIASKTLEKARAGYYRDLERKIEPHLLQTYFQLKDSGWQADPSLRAAIRFACLNLLDEQALAEEHFDVIFCRYVGIYFNAEVRRRLIYRLVDHLSPGGVLIVGASESITGMADLLKRHRIEGLTYYQCYP
jgi:chemotaxis protein methyltransferase CheR